MPHFHHFSMFNQNQSMSIVVISGQTTKAIALPFGQKLLIFHHFSMFNQTQSMSSLVIFGQTTKAIALLFGQKWLIFITFQCSIKINQFQVWSFVGKTPRLKPYFLPTNGSVLELFNVQSKSINFNCGHLCAKYQGYSLTFRPNMAHFHHFSICNQNQSISILVICGQNTKAKALLFAHKWLCFRTVQCSIKINQFQLWSFVGKTPRLMPYFSPTNGSVLELLNVQSKSIKFNFGHLWAKHQGQSLTFRPQMALF